jgi:hypothetical protein
MKNIRFVLLFILVYFFHSCFISQYQVGNIEKGQPVIRIGCKKNHYLIYGLAPLSNKQIASDVIGNRKNYIIKTQRTLVDMIISILTKGIYTTTTTEYYIPVDTFENMYTAKAELNKTSHNNINIHVNR